MNVRAIGRMAVLERPVVFGLLVLTCVIVGLASEFVAPPDPDNAFLLYAAARVLDGARLYVDVVEINPPLIVAFNFPAILLARGLGLPDILVFRIVMGLILVLSLVALQLGLRVLLPGERAWRRWVTVLAAVALFLAPGEVFSEREHLMLALVLPYIFVIIARRMNHSPAGWALHVVGVMAGFGVALKPQFVVLWVALEGWLAVAHRSRPRVRIENAWVLGVLIAYAGAVLVLTPQYLTLVRDMGGAYLAFLRNSFLVTLLFGEGSRLPLVALLAYLALRKASSRPGLSTGLAVSVLGLLLVATIQQKGWNYHFYPASACSIMLLGVLVASLVRPLRSLAERLYGTVALAVLVAAIVGASVAAGWRAMEPRGGQVELHSGFWDLADLVHQRAAGEPVAVLSYNMRSAWPLVPYAGAEWPLRFPSLWILWVLYAEDFGRPAPLQYRAIDRASALEQNFIDAVVDDVVRSRPRLLLVLSTARDVPDNGDRRLDYLAYFQRDARFAEALTGYRYLTTVGLHDVYERDAGFAGGPGRPPHHAQGDLAPVPRAGFRFTLADPVELLQLLVLIGVGGIAIATGWHRGRAPA